MVDDCGSLILQPSDPPGFPRRSLLGGDGGSGSRAAAAAILDIPTPECGQTVKGHLSRISRRVFSRAMLGVKLPGRYYFLTLTSSPQSPDVKKSWLLLRKKISREFPRSCHLHVITNEGYGVIHLVVRLGRGEKRIEIVPLRTWWIKTHRAKQIVILRVTRREDLAKYISDQRHKKALAGEFAWQDGIVSWGYSKGWLPKSFGVAFGRFWHDTRDMEMVRREVHVHDWLLRCFEVEKENPGQSDWANVEVLDRPRVE